MRLNVRLAGWRDDQFRHAGTRWQADDHQDRRRYIFRLQNAGAVFCRERRRAKVVAIIRLDAQRSQQRIQEFYVEREASP